MDTSIQNAFELAEGFRFTDQLSSARRYSCYRIAYGPVRNWQNNTYADVLLYNVDGSEPPQELLGSKPVEGCQLAGKSEQRKIFLRCFSPDGSTLYYYDGQMHTKNLATGEVRTLEGIPQEAPFDWLLTLECFPDNRTLLLKQTAQPQFVQGRAPVSPYRLCRVATDGTDFRVLYEDPPEYRLDRTACCWQRGFVLINRTNQMRDKDRNELWKVNLESGEATFVGRPSDVGWDMALSPDGEWVAWSNVIFPLFSRPDMKGIFLYSLAEQTSRRLTSVGTRPAWSPDGKTIAFMEDQYKLCLLDVESGHTQDVIWFKPPYLTYKQRKGRSYTVTPVWSPDGQMLWFSLVRTCKLPPPQSLSEMLEECRRYVQPVLDNLNPKRTSHHVGYQRHIHAQRIGIVDLSAKQVVLWQGSGLLEQVSWLPKSGNLQGRVLPMRVRELRP